jgi:hypothetical protein
MAREVKRMEVRLVDETIVPEDPLVRLSGREVLPSEKPVRLGPASQPAQKLALPAREDISIRTHQPDFDSLLEQEAALLASAEQNWGGQRISMKSIPWGWWVLGAILLGGALVWGLVQATRGERQASAIRSEASTRLEEEDLASREAGRLVDRLEKALHGFCNAASVEERLVWSRHPERVEPLMRAYYRSQAPEPKPIREVRVLQPLTLDNRADFWMASLNMADGLKQNLILEVLPGGKVVVDWETAVCHQPMDWTEYVRERPHGSHMDFRVYVEPDVFYSHEFSSADQWFCLRLEALDSEEFLFGYVRREDNLALEIAEILRQNGGRAASLLLRLSLPYGLKAPRGVIIERMISPRWILVDPPEEP